MSAGFMPRDLPGEDARFSSPSEDWSNRRTARRSPRHRRNARALPRPPPGKSESIRASRPDSRARIRPPVARGLDASAAFRKSADTRFPANARPRARDGKSRARPAAASAAAADSKFPRDAGARTTPSASPAEFFRRVPLPCAPRRESSSSLDLRAAADGQLPAHGLFALGAKQLQTQPRLLKEFLLLLKMRAGCEVPIYV